MKVGDMVHSDLMLGSMEEDKPYFIKNFIQKDILNWSDIEKLSKNYPAEYVGVINRDNAEQAWNGELKEENSYIFRRTRGFKRDFETIYNFLKIKDNLQVNSNWDVHIYTSFNKGKSFKKHNDKASNFIIQCQGECRWIVEMAFDIILKKGDLIYIPYEWYHQCLPLTKRISISIPIAK